MIRHTKAPKSKHHFNESNIINLKWTFSIWTFYNFIGSRVHASISNSSRVGLTQIPFRSSRCGLELCIFVLQHDFNSKVISFCARFRGGADMSHPQRLLAISLLGQGLNLDLLALHQDGSRPPLEASRLCSHLSELQGCDFDRGALVVNFSCVALISVALIAAFLWIRGVYAKAFLFKKPGGLFALGFQVAVESMASPMVELNLADVAADYQAPGDHMSLAIMSLSINHQTPFVSWCEEECMLVMPFGQPLKRRFSIPRQVLGSGIM